MTHFFTIISISCFIYYLIIIKYAGISADFAWIWPFMAVISIALGWGIRFSRRNPDMISSKVKLIITILIVAGCFLFFYISSLVIRGMMTKGEKNLEYVIVLGAQVKGEKPSRALVKRLDCAIAYKKNNPDTILILSGGQGDGEFITEAECMRRYLVEQGVCEADLILEEKSVNTKENLLFSHKISGCAEKKTGILSNNFHIYRAVALAKKQGYQKAYGLPAASDPIMQTHYVIREVFALVKEKIKGNI